MLSLNLCRRCTIWCVFFSHSVYILRQQRRVFSSLGQQLRLFRWHFDLAWLKSDFGFKLHLRQWSEAAIKRQKYSSHIWFGCLWLFSHIMGSRARERASHINFTIYGVVALRNSCGICHSSALFGAKNHKNTNRAKV